MGYEILNVLYVTHVENVVCNLPVVTKKENKLSTRVLRICSMSESLASALFSAKIERKPKLV